MKRKSAIIGFSYLAGLICASFLRDYDFLLFAVFILLSALLFLLRRRVNKAFALSALVIGLGFGVFGVYQYYCRPVYALAGQTMEVTGTVISKSETGNDMSGYIIESEINGVSVRFSLYGTDTDAEYGDTVKLKAVFDLFSDSAVFSEESYYSSKGILLKAVEKSAITVEKAVYKSPLYYVYRYNDYIRDKILIKMPDDTGALLCALLLGDKSHMSENLGENIKRSGIAHFAAVSGLHLTIIAHIFMLLLELTPLKSKRKLKFAFLSVIILAFMFFFKLTPSVVRAGIMLIVYYGGNLFMRRGSTLNSMGFALLLILAVTPYACLDTGLLFSAAGTFGIGVVAPAVNAVFKSVRFKTIRELFIGTICAAYCTLPLSAVFFKGISIVSPVTNIILQPFFMIVLVMTLVFMVLGGVFALPLFIAGIMSKLMIVIINFFGNLKYNYVPLDYDFMLPWAAFAFLFVTISYLLFRSTGKAVKAGIITVFALIIMILADNLGAIDNTKLLIYSDGGAGVVILKNRSDSVIVATDDSGAAAVYIESFLKNNFIDKASVLCLLGSTKNAADSFEEIPCGVFVSPSDKACAYDVSGKFKFYFDGGRAFIEYNGYLIEINDIKKFVASEVKPDLTVLYGYKLKRTSIAAENIVYISRRMPPENENEQNAYYENIKFDLRVED